MVKIYVTQNWPFYPFSNVQFSDIKYIQFGDIKYIHIVVQPSLLSISRTVSSSTFLIFKSASQTTFNSCITFHYIVFTWKHFSQTFNSYVFCVHYEVDLMAKAVNTMWSLPSGTLNLVEEMAIGPQFESCRAFRRRTLRYNLHKHFLIIAHLVCNRFVPVIILWDICRYKYIFTFQVILWRFLQSGITGLLVVKGQ